MVGFKLTCLKCGNESIVKQDGEGIINFDNKEVEFYSTGYEGQVGISCEKCDNKAIEE